MLDGAPPATEQTLAPFELGTAVDWDLQAACRGVDTEAFYGTTHASVARAKGICGRCFVQTDCLLVADALEGGLGPKMVYGIWGGLTPEERLERRRTRTRLRSARA
jgi:WhiB family transcriptional regulator, redox-sensing transcriptional regulator